MAILTNTVHLGRNVIFAETSIRACYIYLIAAAWMQNALFAGNLYRFRIEGIKLIPKEKVVDNWVIKIRSPIYMKWYQTNQSIYCHSYVHWIGSSICSSSWRARWRNVIYMKKCLWTYIIFYRIIEIDATNAAVARKLRIVRAARVNDISDDFKWNDHIAHTIWKLNTWFEWFYSIV